MPNYTDLYISTKQDCLNFGGDWLRDMKTNFDDIAFSMITVFIMSQSFNWVDAMNKAVASRGIDMNPMPYSDPFISFFFILFIIVGSFFITNLFVGVVISTYNRESEKLGDHFLLTD